MYRLQCDLSSCRVVRCHSNYLLRGNAKIMIALSLYVLPSTIHADEEVQHGKCDNAYDSWQTNGIKRSLDALVFCNESSSINHVFLIRSLTPSRLVCHRRPSQQRDTQVTNRVESINDRQLIVLLCRRCGSEPSAEKVAAAEKSFTANRVSAAARGASYKMAPINVYFHVIQKSDAPEGGNVP